MSSGLGLLSFPSRLATVFWLVIAVAFSLPPRAACAANATFQLYDAGQGLESLGGSCLIQAPTGFMLVCTEHGVFAYDGRRFFNLGPAQGLRQGGMPLSLALLPDGRIAVGFADEVLVSDRATDAPQSPDSLVFRPVQHAGQSFYNEGMRRMTAWRDTLVLLVGEDTERVVFSPSGPARLVPMDYAPKEAAVLRRASAVFSAGGHLWEAFADGRLCKADPGMVRCYDAAEGLQGGPWFDLVGGPGGQLYARSLTAVAALAPASDRWTMMALPDQGSRYLNYKTRLGLFRTPDGTLLTQTEHGVAFLRQGSWLNFPAQDGAPAGIIVSALTDENGQLWFQVFGRGLARWLGYGHWESVQRAEGLSEGIAWQTARAPGGSLWVSTDSGVDEVQRQGGALHVGRVFSGSSFAIAVGPHGKLWRSSGEAGAKVTDPQTGQNTQIDVPPVNAIVAGRGTAMWIGTLGGLFKVDDTPQSTLTPTLGRGLKTPVVSMMADEADGMIYIAAGRLRHRRSDGSDVPVGGIWPGDGFQPLALARGHGQDMWVGGAGGLYRLSLDGERVTQADLVPTEDTRSNSITAVMVDHRGWVWAGTALGVSVFDGHRWVSVDADAGLVSDDVDQLGLREDPDGSVWIVTSQGLSHLLDPGWLFADHPLSAFVSGETLADRPVLGKSLRFTRDAISFRFGTSSYGSEHSVTFRYTLSGVDAGWAETMSGLVRYPSIPPGHHVLSVVAYDELTHSASPPATLAVDICYPWWRRWWSEILWVFCVVGLAYGAICLWMRRLNARQAMLRRLVDGATRELQHQAAHDSLTGLLNRSEIEKQLANKLARMPADHQVLIGLIDIDHFKSVNDEYGHLAGDEVLRRLGGLIHGLVRSGECAGRYGGEEILLVLDDSDRRGMERTVDLHGLIRDESTVTASGHTIHVTCSIGLASAVQGDDWESLIGRADNALYDAKASGRDKIVEGRHEVDRLMPGWESRRAPERRPGAGLPAFGTDRSRATALTADLRKVDPEAEMELFYQPIVSIQGGGEAGGRAGQPAMAGVNVVGYEALLRWHHPTRGLIMPSDFVRLSEEGGSINRLGAWVLKRACIDAAGWAPHLTVAINVSPMQFRSADLLERVREALAASGIAPGRVELEVTETTMLLDDDAALFTLRQLRALGIKIALDDFGTGFSSMSYLRWFTFDRIKIDRSFVSDICLHEEAATITRTILNLGRSLHIPVTAEGVETAEQVALLRAEGCTHAQGYLFGRPEPRGQRASLATAD